MTGARRRSGARRRFDSDERRAVPVAMVGIRRAILGLLLPLSRSWHSESCAATGS
jgi:hypothetical protein